jgi:GMP synthase-like glutamine amidotransferase
MIQDMKFLVLQHISIEHPGIFLDFMKKDKIHIDTVELDEGEKIPKLDSYDAMIVMGGPMDTWQEETYPWLKTEKEEIHKFVSVMKKPFLGLCLGAQLLSEVVGGKVRKMKTPEIGVMDISITNTGSIFNGMNKNLKVLQWHSYEVCDLPKNTDLLASSPLCGVQAFSCGNAFGLQFHVEQTNETVPQWACVPEYKSALEKTLGSNALEKFRKEVEVNLKIFNGSARTIYDNFKKII